MTIGIFKSALTPALFTAIAALAFAPAPANASHITDDGANAPKTRLVMPIMSPQRGREIFVDKGCVACHAINGVGGHDAPPMDAHSQARLMNPFAFAAKMWNHAPGMIAAQEQAFGEQLYFTGEELADITAFVHDDDAQHDFGEKDITAKAKKMMAHEHGGAPAPKAHAKEIGHGHGPNSKPHKD